VLSGEADSAVRSTLTANIVARLCKQGDRIQFENYPEVDAGSVIGDSAREQMAWIQGRFAGRASPANCR